jgi:hypothetical protein
LGQPTRYRHWFPQQQAQLEAGRYAPDHHVQILLVHDLNHLDASDGSASRRGFRYRCCGRRP